MQQLRHREERYRALASLILVAIAVAAIGCTERQDDPLGFELVEEVVADTGPFRIDLESSDLDTFFQTTRQDGPELWTGFFAEPGVLVEAKALLRFDVTLPAGAELLEGTIGLGCDGDGDYGSPATTVNVAAQSITDGTWYEDLTTGYPFDAHDDGVPLATSAISICTVDSAGIRDIPSFTLPTELVSSWSETPEENHGIAFVPLSGANFKRFVRDLSTLTLRYIVGPDTTMVELLPSHHTTIYSLHPEVEANGTGGEPVALVGGPHDFRGIVRFNLDALPEGANVQRMFMTLHLDPTATLAVDNNEIVSIGMHRTVSIPGEMLDPRPAVSFLAIPTVTTEVNVVTDSTIVVDVSAFGAEFRDGVILRHTEAFPPLSRFGFGTREGEAALRPRLEVTYTLPALIRL